MDDKNLVNGKAVNCFAMCEGICSVLKVTHCVGCKFFKTQKQLKYEQSTCSKRLERINFKPKHEDYYEC